MMMSKKYYANYSGKDDVLIFDTVEERDEFVTLEKDVHPECRKISERRAKELMKNKVPVYDESFGCMVVLG